MQPGHSLVTHKFATRGSKATIANRRMRMSDATGVGSISGGTLDADAKKKTGKTKEQLTEEK